MDVQRRLPLCEAEHGPQLETISLAADAYDTDVMAQVQDRPRTLARTDGLVPRSPCVEIVDRALDTNERARELMHLTWRGIGMISRGALEAA